MIKQYHVGFTGTRDGMTNWQQCTIGYHCEIIGRMHPYDEIVFHHGECEGADEEFHEIAISFGWTPETHPPIKIFKHSKTASIHDGFRHTPKEYLERDDDIVNLSDEMLVAPKGYVPVRRSGTWYTARKAVKEMKSGIVIWPDGNSEELRKVING